MSPPEGLENLDRLLAAYPLKHLPRAGWQRVGIDAPESVAAHSWGLCWLVLRLCPPHLNRGHCLALATIHDVPEVVVGDLTPHDGVSRNDKASREDRAAVALLADQPALLALVREYADGTSAEARFVHELDKVDMALQALVYRPTADTLEFVRSARARIQTPALVAIVHAIAARMEDRLSPEAS